MHIDFRNSDSLNLKKDDTIDIVTDIRLGDLVTFRRAGRGKVKLRVIEENAANKCRTAVFRVENGREQGTISLHHWRPANPKRLPQAPFSFGAFEFKQFAEWMNYQHFIQYNGIRSKIREYERAVGAAGLPPFSWPKTAIHHTFQLSYLTILALAMEYSIGIELFDDETNMNDLVSEEKLRRVAYMLDYYDEHFPADLPEEQIDEYGSSQFENRLEFTGSCLIPLALWGFDLRVPYCREINSKLPKPIKYLIENHKYKKMRICQFLIVTFYEAFRWLVPEEDSRYWDPLIESCWESWQVHLLRVNKIINSGNLQQQELDDLYQQSRD